jgi:tRNA dimethylallyltransferase
MNFKKIIFVVGPTAVGKSDAAFCLAQNIGGEVISCDSMQVYKEIRVASNKPAQDVLDAVPHHLVSILSVGQEFDVAQFNQHTLEIIDEIHNKDHIPIIVGGSGLYMQILLDGIFKGGVKNEALRRGLKEQANQQGNQFLYDKLKEADPQAASKIHPNDIRRVIRALEVFMGEKMPISQLREDRQGLWGKFDISLFALDRQRPELYDRINARVERMFERGIIDEIKRVEEDQWGKTAKMIIGVQEIQGFLRGEYDLEETKQKIKLNTRRLAKRQLTWFRQEKRLTWVTVGPEDTAESVARTMLDEWKAVR